MRRVALIYNPASGQYSARRAFVVRNLLAALKKAGIDADALETHSPGSAKALARPLFGKATTRSLHAAAMALSTKRCSRWSEQT